jgi:hypothetical protein
MCTRQHARLDGDRPNFVRLPSIDAMTGIENLRTQRVIFDVAQQILDVL